MIIRQYDNIILKDGRRGAVVEILGDNDYFLVDVGSSPKDWANIEVRYNEIEKVVWSNCWNDGEQDDN